MGLAETAEALGPPALKIAGFQLWIHGRQYPDERDTWDADWLNVTAHCGASGASVWVSGALVMTIDIQLWAAACKHLYKEGKGEANLQPCEPNLRVSIRPSDRFGHMLMRVQITPEHMTQQHVFDFEIDQSYLPSLINDCRAILGEYPVRGQYGAVS